MRARLIFILILLPFLVFSQDRVRFKYFENTEKFKSGDFKALVKGVEFYDSTGRMISEYDFTKIEPLDRIYKFGLESNWEESVHYNSDDDCNGLNRYNKQDSLFWSPFITDKTFTNYKLCSVNCFCPHVIFQNDTLVYLFFKPIFYYQSEGGTSFSGFLYKICTNSGVKRINPTNILGVFEFSLDGNWLLVYNSDPDINAELGEETNPKVMVINCLTGVVELTINYFSFGTSALINDSNFYLELANIVYYIKPKEKCYAKFDIENLSNIPFDTFIDKETVFYRDTNNKIIKTIDLRSIKDYIKY